MQRKQCSASRRATRRLFLKLIPIWIGLVLSGGAAARGQSGEEPMHLPSGVTVYNVMGSVSYYSAGRPGTLDLSPTALNLSSDVVYSIGATVGWNRLKPRSKTSLLYTFSYSGNVKYTDWNAMSHYLLLESEIALRPRWRATLLAKTDVYTSADFLFRPLALGTITAMPANADELTALLSGSYTNNQFASFLTGAPFVESPASTLLYGNRALVTVAAGALAYTRSPRLALTFGASAGRAQHLHSPLDSQYRYILDHAGSVEATADASYSVSEKTHIGTHISSYGIFTRFQNTYVQAETAWISRALTRNWFAVLYAGVATARAAAPAVARNLEYIAGGELRYETAAQRLVIRADRNVRDTYGLSAGPVLVGQATWQWPRPKWKCTPFATVKWERAEHAFLDRFEGWLGAVGVSRMLSAHIGLQAQYVYMRYSGRLNVAAYGEDQNAISVSVGWTPHNLFRSRTSGQGPDR